jgi:hypothetical protein
MPSDSGDDVATLHHDDVTPMPSDAEDDTTTDSFRVDNTFQQPEEVHEKYHTLYYIHYTRYKKTRFSNL